MTDFERGYRQGQADYFRWVKTFSGGKPNYVIPPETPEVTPEVTPYVTPDDRGSTGEVPGKYRGSTGEVEPRRHHPHGA